MDSITLTGEQAAKYCQAHIDSLCRIGEVAADIIQRGEPAKRAFIRALCEHLAAMEADRHLITWTDDGQADEAAQAAYVGIREWCEREKQGPATDDQPEPGNSP